MPASIDWAKLRKEYESGEGISTLAKRYSTTRNTIKRRITGESWSVADHSAAQVVRDANRPHATAAQAASAKVVDIATGKAIEQIGEQLADAVASGLLRHAEIENLLLQLAADTLTRSIAGTLRSGTNSSEASERKDAVATAARALEMSREIAGKRPGQASISGADSSTKPKGLRFVIAPRPEQKEAS